MRPNVTKLGKMAVAAAAGLMASVGLVGLAATTTPASAATVTVNRNYAGVNRYDTSAQIAKAKLKVLGTVSNVILATGADFPDALAGNYLAGQLKGVILLTPPSTSDSSYSTYTVPALAALLTGATKNVIILGGTNAVGADVASDLTAKGYTVTRIGGATRYDTANMVDTQAGQTSATTGILATGVKFPDALAAGSLAYKNHFPVILTDGSASALSPQASATISADKITHLLVMGGDAAIPPAQVTATGATVDAQFKGANRMDTAAQLLDYEIAHFGFPSNAVFLASGATFPDALSAGPLGGDPEGTLITNTDTTLGAETAAELKKLAPSTIDVLGGTFAVPAQTATDAQTAAAGGTPSCTGATSTLPELCGAKIISTTLTSQANSSNSAGTVIEYIFSKSLSGAGYVVAGFRAYRADDTVPAGYPAGGVCNLTAGTFCTASSNPNAVRVLFPTLNTQALADALSLATVVDGGAGGPAVTLTNGATNPAGSAAISTGASTTTSAGATNAPNEVSIGAIRAAAAANHSAIDVLFDKPVLPDTPLVQTADTLGGGTGFNLVFNNTASNGGVSEVPCNGPAKGNTTNPASSTTTSFNSSAKTVTIVCPNATGAASTTLTTGVIGWIVAMPLAVESTDSTPVPNGFIEATTSPAHTQPVAGPFLQGVTLTAGSPVATLDEVDFSYGTTGVTVLSPAGFSLYNSAGGNLAYSGAGCTTATPSGSGQQCQISSSTTTTVKLFFPHGTLAFTAGATIADGPVVGATAQKLTVKNSTPGGTTSWDDSLPATPVATTAQSAGVIATSQLASATIGSGGVTYKYDTSIKTPVAGKFKAYDADGTGLYCTTITLGTAAADNTATCTTYNQLTAAGATTGTSATSAQLGSIALVSVDNGAALGNIAGNTPAPSGNPTPEDAAA